MLGAPCQAARDASPWLVRLMQPGSTKVAAIALANRTARTIWALMTSGERYRGPTASAALAA